MVKHPRPIPATPNIYCNKEKTATVKAYNTYFPERFEELIASKNYSTNKNKIQSDTLYTIWIEFICKQEDETLATYFLISLWKGKKNKFLVSVCFFLFVWKRRYIRLCRRHHRDCVCVCFFLLCCFLLFACSLTGWLYSFRLLDMVCMWAFVWTCEEVTSADSILMRQYVRTPFYTIIKSKNFFYVYIKTVSVTQIWL